VVLYAEHDAGNQALVDRLVDWLVAWCGTSTQRLNNTSIQTWAPLLELTEATEAA